MEIYRSLPPEAVKILLVLFLSFLIGLEREEHKVGAAKYSFGGVRTFPLIGLIGYLAALLSGPELVPLTVGFLISPRSSGYRTGTSYRHPVRQALHQRCRAWRLI